MYNDQNGVPVPVPFVEASSEASRILYEDNLTGATIQIKVRGGLELSSAASNADGSIVIIPPSGGVSFSEIQITLTTAGQAKITKTGTRAGLFVNSTPIVSLQLTLIPWDRLDAFAETAPLAYTYQSDEQRKTLVIPVGRVGASLDWASILNRPATFPPSTHTHTSGQISDGTAAGRALFTAPDVPAQRTALGLGSAAQQASSAFEPAGSVAAEAAARIAADNALAADLTAEANTRLSADNALDSRLDAAESWAGVQEEFVWAGAALNLSRTPRGGVLVFVAGAPQIGADRTIVGNQITALPNAQVGDTVIAYYWG